MYCAKTAEPIEMPFGGKTYGDMCHSVAKGVAIPHGKGAGGGALVRVNSQLAIFPKLLGQIAPNLAQMF